MDVFKQNLAYQYENFNSIEDYQKPVIDLKKKVFLSKLKNKCPDDEEMERTKEIFKLFDIKNGEELTGLYMKTVIFCWPMLLKFL